MHHFWGKWCQTDCFFQVGTSYGKKAEPGTVLCNTVLVSWIAIIKGGLNSSSLTILMLYIIYYLSRFCVLWPIFLFTLVAWWEWTCAVKQLVQKIQWAQGPVFSLSAFRGKLLWACSCLFPWTDCQFVAWSLSLCSWNTSSGLVSSKKNLVFSSKTTPCCKPERSKEGQPEGSVSWFKLMCCCRHTSVIKFRQL